MKLLFITHASFERPGSIETWAKAHRHDTFEVAPFKGEALPDIDDYDFLIIMGGPQSTRHLNETPYLLKEINFIKAAVQKQKRIIGVCLGAQLLALALGAPTEQSPNKEIGVFPLQLLPEAADDPIFCSFNQTFDVTHWHGDMPGLPANAVLLARSEGCPRQIFRVGDRIYGFQCHFELTKELVENLIKHCPEDLAVGNYVRSKDHLLSADYHSINTQMDRILNHLSSLP